MRRLSFRVLISTVFMIDYADVSGAFTSAFAIPLDDALGNAKPVIDRVVRSIVSSP